jgi:orotate phosphoribosyltransferase
MPEIKRDVAAYLLQSKAIILEPAKPFTWASGWKSPIYCDNRITLSFPVVRDYIKKAFAETIQVKFGVPDLIAGVATGAIAQGALVSDQMGLPFIYVRSSAKGHGRQNLVEGKLIPGQNVVVVEDLVSTGGSSLKAVEAIQEAGGNVIGMVAIFSYGFPVSSEAFEKAGVKLEILTDYNTMIDLALQSGYIKKEEVELLQQWRMDPSGWKGA